MGDFRLSTFILAEKPDQARAYMRGLGIKYKTDKSDYGRGKTFLDDDTVVIGSSGHMFELAEPERYGEKYKDRSDLSVLPIFPKKFKYEGRSSLAKIFDMMSNAGKYANRIIVATDKDNEGGAIAFNILRFAGLLDKNIVRAYPTGLDPTEVKRTFENLEPIDQTWRDAQSAISRSRSDWLIGMNLSRLYTTNLANIGIYGNFAVGRAISSTLSLICAWYKEIEDFREEPTFSLGAVAELKPGIDVKLTSPIMTVGDGKNDPKAEIMQIVKERGLEKKMLGTITDLKSETKERFAPELLTKSSLYSEMARVAGWSQKRSKATMQLNYEQGWQTYPRTDSSKISNYMYNYLYEGFNKYLHALNLDGQFTRYSMPADKLDKYITKEKSAGAHMAIIPTEQIMPTKEEEAKILEKQKQEEEKLKKEGKSIDEMHKYIELTDDQRLMLDVVYRNTLALLLEPYKYVSNKIDITAGTGEGVTFSASNSATLSPGWKVIIPKSKPKKHGKKKSDDKEKMGFDYSSIVQKGQKVPLTMQIEEGKTKPLSPLKSIQIYGKHGLMEKAYKYAKSEKEAKILKRVNGIGTSATKDEIIKSLETKGYINVDSKDVISVTANGWLMNRLMEGSKVSSVGLTATWEEAYDQISKGKIDPSSLINATAQLVMQEMKRVGTNWQSDKINAYYKSRKLIDDKKLSAGLCPKCNEGYMVFSKYHGKIEKGKNGNWDCWRCDKCDFALYKKWGKGAVSFTESDMKQMLKGKTTRLIKGIKSAKGKKYDAKFKLGTDEKTNLPKIEPVFDNTKKPTTQRKNNLFS